MGACLSCLKGSDDDGEVIEFSTTMNAAVTCKLGLKGDAIKVGQNISTSSYTISGSGTAIGSCALDCDVAYWEVRVGKQPENVRIGIKRFNPKKGPSLNGQLEESGESEDPSWCLTGVELKPGDVVGVCWDQTDLPMLSFCVNGTQLMQGSVNRIRPSNDIYPAVSVSDGAECEIVFDGNHFWKAPPSSKFKMIVCATSLI